MEYQTPKSKCQLCKSEFTGRGLTKHLKLCLTKHLDRKGKTRTNELFYIVVSDTYDSAYFLHLLLQGNTTLEYLDNFLRDIWLECCGHLSAFMYERFGNEINMKRKIKDVFEPGSKLSYEYDFGSTTALTIKAIDVYYGSTDKNKKIQIVARNAQPLIPCDNCGQGQAIWICAECQWNESGWLCERCAEDHECGDEMLLPVVNSPRTGVCGYTGQYMRTKLR